LGDVFVFGGSPPGCHRIFSDIRFDLTMASIPNRNLIPSDINTWERLIGWAMSVGFNLMGNLQIPIFPNEPMSQQAVVNTIVAQDGRKYWQCICYLPYNYETMNGPAKPWMSINNVTEAQPHENFTSN